MYWPFLFYKSNPPKLPERGNRRMKKIKYVEKKAENPETDHKQALEQKPVKTNTKFVAKII